LHLAEDTFALHLLLQDTQRLIDIVVANENLHGPFNLLSTDDTMPCRTFRPVHGHAIQEGSVSSISFGRWEGPQARGPAGFTAFPSGGLATSGPYSGPWQSLRSPAWAIPSCAGSPTRSPILPPWRSAASSPTCWRRWRISAASAWRRRRCTCRGASSSSRGRPSAPPGTATVPIRPPAACQ